MRSDFLILWGFILFFNDVYGLYINGGQQLEGKIYLNLTKNSNTQKITSRAIKTYNRSTNITITPFTSENETSKNNFNKIIPRILNLISSNNQTESKQLFGGKLPPFLENIVQRIQNYFSVYNPPQYFEHNRPPSITENDISTSSCPENDTGCAGDAIIETTANLAADFEMAFDECSEIASNENSIDCSESNNCDNDDSQKITIITNITYSEGDDVQIQDHQKIIQKNQLNMIYTSAIVSDSDQSNSNVIIILEPTPSEHDTPIIRPTFYAYTKNKQISSTREAGPDSLVKKLGTDSGKYTIILYKNPELNNFKTEKDVEVENESECDCDQNSRCFCLFGNKRKPVPIPTVPDKNPNQPPHPEKVQNSPVDSSGVAAPNINLVLIPIELYKNKTCYRKKPFASSSNSDSEPNNVEYYLLSPESSNFLSKLNVTKTGHKMNDNIVQNLSLNYLPPPPTEEEIEESEEEDAAEVDDEVKLTTSTTISAPINPSSGSDSKYPILNRFPFLNRILKRRHEEPRNI